VLNQCELKRFETFEHFLIKDIYKKIGLCNKIWWTYSMGDWRKRY